VTAEPTGPPHDPGEQAELAAQDDVGERQPEPTVPPPLADRRGIPADSTSDLWVFSFDGELRAREALLAASRLVARKQLELEDAAIVTVRNGRVRLAQTRDLNPSQGAVGGAWFGTLAGFFAGLPLVGAALGAAVGGLYARLRDFGIEDDAMKDFGRTLEGDRAALFLLVRDCHRMRALHEVARFPARLERSSADPDLVAQVRSRLAIDPWDG
jgi:uncharacterized membrane protein